MTRHFTDSHEWIELDGEIATVGITNYAQGQLGDVVFVELPAVGVELHKGAEAAVVESVKAASEVYSPVSGVVTEVNSALEDDPALVNFGAEGDGWFVRLRITEPGELDGMMDQAAYAALVADLS
jgi:glycine cleavage system H protein